MTCLNLPEQSASLLSGPPGWSKVLDQPVTARGCWLERNSCTSHWSQVDDLSQPTRPVSQPTVSENTLQGEPGPFQKQVTHKVSGTKVVFWP